MALGEIESSGESAPLYLIEYPFGSAQNVFLVFTQSTNAGNREELRQFQYEAVEVVVDK
jgi:hypothetical protein